MKLVASSVASLLALLAPAAAFACPASAAGHCGSCGSSSFAGYGIAVAVGLLVGAGSVAVERRLRR